MKVSIQILKSAAIVVLLLTSVMLYALEKTETVLEEDWEGGIGSWWANNGVWELGIPFVGPDSSHSGQKCAGTILDGNYPDNANTRLISPPVTLPNPSGGETIQLKFWHWFEIENNHDQGYLQISENSGEWITISEVEFDGHGGTPVWTQYVADLTSYAGSSIRIGFYFTSNSGYTLEGWYIDDIRIEGVITEVNEILNPNSNEYTLSQNYPNPFAQQTKIDYSIHKDENVQLIIYNMKGRLIETLVDKKLQKGNYSVIWNGKNDLNDKVVPGIYYYKLKTTNNLITKKMLVVK